MGTEEDAVTLTAMMETGTKYGKDFLLVTILLGAMGAGLTMVWTSIQNDMKEQDGRIANNDQFIRDKLIDSLAETQNVTRECKSIIEDNTDATKESSRVLEKVSDVLSRVNAQLSAYPTRPPNTSHITQ